MLTLLNYLPIKVHVFTFRKGCAFTTVNLSCIISNNISRVTKKWPIISEAQAASYWYVALRIYAYLWRCLSVAGHLKCHQTPPWLVADVKYNARVYLVYRDWSLADLIYHQIPPETRPQKVSIETILLH